MDSLKLGDSAMLIMSSGLRIGLPEGSERVRTSQLPSKLVEQIERKPKPLYVGNTGPPGYPSMLRVSELSLKFHHLSIRRQRALKIFMLGALNV